MWDIILIYLAIGGVFFLLFVSAAMGYSMAQRRVVEGIICIDGKVYQCKQVELGK